MNTRASLPFIILMACLSVGGLISTDIFLPALAPMSHFYQVSESSVQSAISIFLFGIAFSQLIYGPLSDSLGRKKLLIAGMIIWLLSTLGIFMSHDIHQLLILRLLQGIGSCAGITLSRAMINDRMNKEQAAQLYLVIFPFVGMSPAIAPMIGGVLNTHFGWQSCFLFLTLFIAVTLCLCLRVLKESLPASRRAPFSPAGLIVSTLDVMQNRTFLYYACVPCFAYAAWFAYLVESPFILTRLGMPANAVGYTYILLSASYVFGNLSAKKVSRNYGMDYAISRGYLIFSLGGIAFALQMYVSPWPLITSIVSIALLTFGNGFLLPLGTASAIASHGKSAGSASGLMGALQSGSAALATLVIGYISHHEPIPVALIIALIGSVGCVIYMAGYVSNKLIIKTERE